LLSKVNWFWFLTLTGSLSSLAIASSSEPSLSLVASASEAPPDGVVSIVLNVTNMPDGSIIAVQPPLRGDLWIAGSACGDVGHLKTLTLHPAKSPTGTSASTGPQNFSSSALLCLTSGERQSVRAVVSATSPDGRMYLGHSEAVKFSAERWWNSPVFTALLGAALGVLSTLFTQKSEYRRRAKEEAKAIEHEQALFLVKSLLPELASHVRILSANASIATGGEAGLESLPLPNLVEMVRSDRPKRLAAYLGSGSAAGFVGEATRYSTQADEYNDTIETILRGQQPVSALATLAANLLTKLKAWGFSP
jgi:hypothetical protein